MSPPNRGSLDARSDREFERALLESARADEPPAETSLEVTRKAWAQLAARIAVVSGVPRPGAPREDTWPDNQAPSTGAAHPVSSWGPPWGPARWLVLGAIGGAAMVGALARSPSERTAAPLPAPAHTSDVGTREPEIRDAPPGRVPASSASAPPAAPSERRRPAAPVLRGGERRKAALSGPQPASPSSSLAAEVAALDAARSAATRGSFDETLRLISQYRYDFPRGELAADADVVAIEALVAKADQAEAARHAARFLARYPNDPHAAHIRRLTAPNGGAP